MSMKNSNDTIGNRTRDLLTCSAVRHRVPQLGDGVVVWERNRALNSWVIRDCKWQEGVVAWSEVRHEQVLKGTEKNSGINIGVLGRDSNLWSPENEPEALFFRQTFGGWNPNMYYKKKGRLWNSACESVHPWRVTTNNISYFKGWTEAYVSISGEGGVTSLQGTTI